MKLTVTVEIADELLTKALENKNVDIKDAMAGIESVVQLSLKKEMAKTLLFVLQAADMNLESLLKENEQ